MKKYWPLVVLIGIAALGSSALTIGTGLGGFSWMHFFMGLFFCQFSMLKLFNIKGFAEGFSKYDLVAKKFYSYGYVYPWIELVLGLAYLSFVFLQATYILTIGLMGVGAVGVVWALKKGLDVRCACMGTILNVPLSTVSLIEDIAMIVMAITMLRIG